MAANQVDFKILPSDQFSVYSPQTRSDKVITYFTLLSKLRGDILSVGQDDDPNDIVSAFYSSVGGTQTLHLVKADGSEITASVPEPTVGTVTSVDLTASTGISVSGGPITTSGSITVTNTAPDQVVVLTGAGTTSISGTYPSFTITSNDQYVGTVTSVGLTMPAAFSVANSPVTNSGTLAVTAIGLSSQYIRGDGQLANFPTPGGGGSSVNYYLNGSVNQGTFGGVTYYELSKTPIAGAGTNFTRTNASGDGYVASFITDANDPDQINIPGGNFNLEFYFNSSSSGGSPAFYGELYKVSTSNVFTLIASGSANPEVISGGTFVDQYYTSIAVPQTALLATDRLAIRVYVIVDGRNITLHTEDANFSEVITTFSTGLNSLNGLSDQVQYFAVGTSGTDFAISSSVDTHTFNLPTASAANRGALSSADWTTFNGKASDAFKTIAVAGQSDIVADNATDTLTIVAGTNVTITTNATTDTITINSADQFVGTVTSVATTAPITGGTIITTGTIGITQSGAAADGYLSSTDWNTFNSKEPALTKGNLTEATSSVLTITGGTGAVIGSGTTIQVSQATTTTSGFLSSTDWNTFNNKQGTITLTTTGTTGAATFISNTLNIPNYADQFVGTVTSVNLTAGDRIEVSGGPITTSGSITVTHGTSSGADVTTAQSFRLRVIADGGTFEAFNDVAIAIGSLEDIATPQDTDNSGGTVLQNIVLDEFGHLLGVGSITLDTDDIIEGPTNLYFTNARARSALSAGTGITYDTSTGIITNSAPDQVVVLTAGTGITTSGTYPSFTITNSLPDQTVVLTAGTGITTSGTYPNFTVTNSAPDQTVVLTAGTGITTSGTYPNFTVTNAAPDQTVVLTAGTGISVSGTYPSFTVTNSSPSSGGTVTSVAALTIGTTGTDLSSTVVNGTTTPVITLQVPTASAANRGALSSTDWTTFNGKQSAITLTTTGSTGAATFISNTLNIPNYTDQFVGTVTSVATTAPITGGTFTTTGTIGITQSGVSTDGYLSSTDWGTFNSKQPQLNGTGFVKASGTTISYDNSTYYLASNPSGFTTNTGTVTSVNLTAGARIEVAGGPITTSGSITVTHGVADGADFVTAEEFRDRVIADGGIFEALGEVAIAIGSLSDAASPSSTDYSDGYVLQNIAIDEFGHVLGVGVTDLDDRYAQLGLGTTNFLAKWSSPSELVTSIASDNGTGIGIGISSASYKLEVSGDIKVSSGSIGVGVNPNTTDGRIDASNDIVAFSSSDLRLKENIKPIENALDKVKSLTGVEFDWKPELKHAHGYEGHDTGVIAQEVQEVMPTAIRTNDTGYLAVRYEKLIGLLIEANKELAARVEQLESKLK